MGAPASVPADGPPCPRFGFPADDGPPPVSVLAQMRSEIPNECCVYLLSLLGKHILSSFQQHLMPVFPLKQTELQILRVLFVIPVLLGIASRALSGGSLLESVVGGGVLGGLAFIPVAFIYFAYLFGKRRSVVPA